MNKFKTLGLTLAITTTYFASNLIGYHQGVKDTATELQPQLKASELENDALSLMLDYSNKLSVDLRNNIETLKEEINAKNELLAKPVTIETNKSIMFDKSFESDSFVITAYSPYDDRNYINSDGNPNDTATGTTPGPGTFAVDPNVIPYGSTVIILYPDGTIERGVAEDTGGAIKGNRIDVFRYTFPDAIQFGKKGAVVIWYKDK